MRPESVVRRTAQGTVVLCATGGAAVAGYGDSTDAVLIGLLGVLAFVTARKATWKLRQDREGTTSAEGLWPRDGSARADLDRCGIFARISAASAKLPVSEAHPSPRDFRS